MFLWLYFFSEPRSQEMDQETFKAMWELSKPGGLAEGCFLRLPQTEYYGEQYDEPHPLSWMPDVSRSILDTLSKLD